VTTESLAKEVRRIVPKGTPTWVHRNFMGKELVALGSQVSRRIMGSDKLRIFYGSGTKAHKQVFYDVLAPALAQILEQYPHVELHIVGFFKLPKVLERFEDRVLLGKVSADYSVYLQQLKRADINLAILERSIFTDCKSEIKWLEAAAFGIPSVVTPTETYTGILHDGQDVLFASNIPQWTAALERLIKDPSLRERVGKNARALAFAEYGSLRAQESAQQILAHYLPTPPVTKRKRILIVNTFFAPQSIGGATRVVEAQVRHLKKMYGNDYEIYVLCADCDPRSMAPYATEQYFLEDVLVTRIYAPNHDWSVDADDKILGFCRDFYLKHGFDLIHFHCVQMLTASVVPPAQELRIPYVITVHDGWWLSRHQFLVDEKGVLVDPKKAFVALDDPRRWLFSCLRQARAVFAVSESFARIYEQAGLKNVIANENGVDPFEPKPRTVSPSGKVRIAHIGGKRFHKGFHLFREAFEEGDFKNLEAVVIDEGVNPDVVIKEMWGSTKVTTKKGVRQAEISSLYSDIDVLVAPSLWPESYGLVTREAKMAGVWVIASDRGAIGADVIEGIDGNVIPVTDHKALMKVLGQIDKNKDFYLNFHGLTAGKLFRRAADQTEELVHFYNKILKGVS